MNRQEFSETHKKELKDFLEVCEKGKSKNLKGLDIFVSFTTEGYDSAGGVSMRDKNGLIGIIKFPQKPSFKIVKNGQVFMVSSLSNVFANRFTNGENNEKRLEKP